MGAAVADRSVKPKNRSDERIGTPEADQEVGNQRQRCEQPAVPAEEGGEGSSDPATWKTAGSRPELVKALGSEAYVEGTLAALAEVRGMEVLRKGLRKEGDLERVLALETVAEFDVFHGCAGEVLVERILAEELSLDGKIAGVEVLPVGGHSAK